MCSYKQYRNLTDAEIILNQMAVLRKYNAVPSKDINTMTNSELAAFKQALKAAKLASSTQADEAVVDLWIQMVEGEEKMRSSQGAGMDVPTGLGRTLAPAGGRPAAGTDNKWPLWKIIAISAGGLAGAGLLVFAIYKVSKKRSKMATEREIVSSVMAKALAKTIISHRVEMDALMGDYGYKTDKLSDEDFLDMLGQKIRERKGLAEAIYSLMKAKLKQYRNADGDTGNALGGIFGGLLGGAGGIMSGIQGIIDATSDSGKKVRETQAQAALEAAKAQQLAAQAQLAAASKRSNTPLVIGIVGGVGLIGLGLFLYFKYGRKKATKPA